MYIPEYYKEEDELKLIEFMKANSFATLVGADNNLLHATHLPFVVEKRNDSWYLISHLAKANPQWEQFFKNELLVIFKGPHGYVSPLNYEKKQNVPTWNYIAVHAYGRVTIINEEKDVLNVLEKMILNYEDSFLEQWKGLTDVYKSNMLKGIVAFEIKISKLQGKTKLSQNKTKNEQKAIINSFEKSHDSVQLSIAEAMKKNL